MRHSSRTWARVLGAAVLVGVLVAFAALGVRSASHDWPQVRLRIAANDERCAIELSGDLPLTLHERVLGVLDRHPQARALILNSAGGSAVGIEQVAQLLRARQVDTAAIHGQCDSACAFLWVSAPKRYVIGWGDEVSIGFHAPHVWLPGIGAVRAPLQERSQREFLLQAGLPPSFIGWAYAPVDTVWRPDMQALNRIGVATNFIRTPRAADVSFCGDAPVLVHNSRHDAVSTERAGRGHRPRRSHDPRPAQL